MRIKPFLLPIVQFTLIGPGIGTLVAILIGSSGAPPTSRVGLLFFFGYSVGLAPGALAGVIYVSAWNARSMFRPLNVGEYGVLLGAFSGAIAFATIAFGLTGSAVLQSPTIYFIPVLAGAFCGWLSAQTRDEAYGWTHVS